MNASSLTNAEVGAQGKLLVRRFTQELAGEDELERSLQLAQKQEEEDEREIELRRAEAICGGGAKVSTGDFDAAEIATQKLQTIIDEYKQKAKPSIRSRLGIQTKSSKAKAFEMLAQLVHNNVEDLKFAIDDLEEAWIKNNGKVYRAFKSVTKTLADHQRFLKLFPSQNDFASIVCGGLSCLLGAAKTHTDIARLFLESIATISDKVLRCSRLLNTVQTACAKRLLGEAFTLMFYFYRDVIRWYLRSKAARAFESFNENMEHEFEKTKTDIEEKVKELYREERVFSLMVSTKHSTEIAILRRNVEELVAISRSQRSYYESEDMTAGQRMSAVLEATWFKTAINQMGARSARKHGMGDHQSENSYNRGIEASMILRAEARKYKPILESFIIGDEGPEQFASPTLYVAEDDAVFKIRDWMKENKSSQSLWISSPYEPGISISGSRAAAMMTVAAAWQAHAPIVPFFCRRPRPAESRESVTDEQAGLIGLVYSLINQLLDMFDGDEEVNLSDDLLRSLDGTTGSWENSLFVLRVLLSCAPKIFFCVIDGLDDLARGDAVWCGQVLQVLLDHQKQPGFVFNILITTTGHSRVLAQYLSAAERHIGTQKAREVAKWSRGLNLEVKRPES